MNLIDKNDVEVPEYVVPTVAATFDVTERTVWRWVEQGLLEYHRLGPRLVRFTASDLQRFIDRGRVSTR